MASPKAPLRPAFGVAAVFSIILLAMYLAFSCDGNTTARIVAFQAAGDLPAQVRSPVGEGLPAQDAQRRVPTPEPPPGESRDPSEIPGQVSIRVRNALDGRLEPAVRVMAVPECKGGETVACVSNGGGELTLPGNRTWTLDVQSDGLRLLVPSQSYGPSTVIQDVWVHRVISASGIVDVECPESAAKGTIRVAARPAFPRGWPRREATGEEAIGSPAWLEKRLGSRGFLWSAEVVDRRYSLEIPVLNSVTLVATAPGHISTVKSVDPDRMSGPGIEMNFLLRKGEVARVSVQDEDGIPIRGASLQFAATLTLSTKDVNLDELRLKRRAVNTGLTLREDGAKGVTHVAFIASTGTDKFGVAEAYQGFDAHSMVLMVTAIGHEPFIKRMEQSGEFSDARITLRKVTPARRGYRLSLHGRCASAGASLQLSEIVDELTLCLKPIKADENGVFSSASIMPGREYVASLFNPGGLGILHGNVQFGSDEVVDISGFE